MTATWNQDNATIQKASLSSLVSSSFSTASLPHKRWSGLGGGNGAEEAAAAEDRLDLGAAGVPDLPGSPGRPLRYRDRARSLGRPGRPLADREAAAGVRYRARGRRGLPGAGQSGQNLPDRFGGRAARRRAGH